jgi:hypothetical protein
MKRPALFLITLALLALCGVAVWFVMPKPDPPPVEYKGDPSLDATWLEHWNKPKKIQRPQPAGGDTLSDDTPDYTSWHRSEEP